MFYEIVILFDIAAEKVVYQVISVVTRFPVLRMFNLLSNDKRANDQHDRKCELKHYQDFTRSHQCMRLFETSFQNLYRLKRREEEGRVTTGKDSSQYYKASAGQPRSRRIKLYGDFLANELIECGGLRE